VAGAALPGRLNWQLGEIVELVRETPRVSSIFLRCPAWHGHHAGQHVDVRLTADDGYQAERSYSLASAPEDELLELTVERLEDGEVSPYLADELHPGDQLEFRGPIGGYFVWQKSLGGPLLLLAGGSGIVPLRAILRHRSATASSVPTRLLYSSRAEGEIIYRDELASLAAADDALEVSHTLTREHPNGWNGYLGRINDEMLREFSWAPTELRLVYVCGPTGFVEQAANGLVRLGHDSMRIRTERFGPTGA
jgi:ferredoxin-NADP reductase